MNGPNYTQIPNLLLDELLPSLSEKELKVLLYIMRRTLGFHKKKDGISISQLCKGIEGKDKGTGLSNRAVIDALDRLNERQLIILEKKERKTTKISLRIEELPYEKSSQAQTLTGEKSSQVPYEKSSQTKERERNKDILSQPKVDDEKEFSLSDQINKLRSDKQPHIRLIGRYIEAKIQDGVDMSHLNTFEAMKVFIKQNVRDAAQLAKFDSGVVLKKIEDFRASSYNSPYEWKLSTILKSLR